MATELIKQMLECGVHFGHQRKKWNPAMEKFVFGRRKNIYIIDLEKTVEKLQEAKNFLSSKVAKGGTVLLVGTKKHARDIVKEVAEKFSVFYVNHRWLGGTLTNFSTIRRSIEKMKELEKKLFGESSESLRKKERARLLRVYNKKFKNFAGIKNMERLPDIVVVVDTQHEKNAVKEARKLKIPTIGIVDTDCNPEDVDFPIPGNDDAFRSIKFLLESLLEVVEDAKVSAGSVDVEEDKADKGNLENEEKEMEGSVKAVEDEEKKMKEEAEKIVEEIKGINELEVREKQIKKIKEGEE